MVASACVDFAVALASAARLFTATQLARHPELSWRSQPARRAKEILREHSDTFERLNGPTGFESRYRLTKKARRKYGIEYRPVVGVSQRADHWLGLGDIYLELTFNGGRPTEWQTEVNKDFDVMCRWRDKLLLIEYQRTPITTKQWAKKWETRKAWYKEQTWHDRPIILLVNTTGQQDSTINVPRGTVHVRRIEDIHHALR